MFNLNKRINRRTYWLGFGLVLIFWAVFATIIAVYPFKEEMKGKFEFIPDVPLIIYILGVLWFAICLTRQRTNDISGEHTLLWFFLSIFLIGPVIGFIPGQKRDNEYGDSSDQINLLRK